MRSLIRCIAILLVFLVRMTSHAATGVAELDALGMSQSTFTQGNLSIDYCERVFRYSQAPMSIVLLWHGGSGRGNDNLTQLSTPSLRPLVDYLSRKRINAIVLVPQCPSSAKSWIDGGERSPMMASRALVRSKAHANRVSPSNTFFAGISMGGTAGWSLLAADMPNLFAKAVICSGGGDTAKSSSITADVRIFNGGKDTVINPSLGEAMASAVNASGGKATYVHLPEHDHFSAADVAFSDPQWDWFFGRGRTGFAVKIQ